MASTYQIHGGNTSGIPIPSLKPDTYRSENLANYLTKGKQVYVEGRLQTGSFDGQYGVKRYITEIGADGVILLGGQQGGSQDQPASTKGNSNGLVSRPRGRASAASARPAGDSSGQEITDNVIPFDSPARFLA